MSGKKFNVIRMRDNTVISQHDNYRQACHQAEIYCERLGEVYHVAPEDTTNTAAVKHDQTKPDYSMLPLADLEGIVLAMMYGAKKYGRDNWKQGGGHDPNRLIAAALRHLAQYQDGQETDDESGLNHIYHATTNLVFLMRQIRLTKVK